MKKQMGGIERVERNYNSVIDILPDSQIWGARKTHRTLFFHCLLVCKYGFLCLVPHTFVDAIAGGNMAATVAWLIHFAVAFSSKMQ